MTTAASPNDAAGDGTPSTGPAPRRSAGRRRRTRWILLFALAVVLVVGGLAAWLGSRVLTVQSDLTAAQTAVNDVRKGADPRTGLRVVADRSASAVDASSGMLWAAAENMPVIGTNLRAARIASQAMHQLSAGLAIPALAALDAPGSEPTLRRLMPLTQRASTAITMLTAQLRQVRTSPDLLPQVRAGVDQLGDVLDAADPVLQILPGMLGNNGPRNYLLAAQTNAEVLALGGSVASQSLIRFADGNATIVKQADSNDYRNGVAVKSDIDQSALDLYNDYLITHLNTSVGRPDFPTAAKTIRAFWNRDIDPDPVDGVISVDPLALAHVMRATGPVKVDGHTIGSDNAVSFLLSRAYQLYEPDRADEIFKQVAMSVMDKLVSGKFDPAKLASAISDGIASGSIMFWSADPAIQEKVADTAIAGILPTTNDETTTIGVFYRDASLGSKIDYYLRSKVNTTTRCEADGTRSFTVSTTVWLDLTKAQSSKLPTYVVGGDWRTKVYRTQLFIYGPPGTTVTASQRPAKKSWNWRPVDSTDLGRPVPSFMTVQDLGAKKVTVSVTFTGPAGKYGPVKVRTTPIAHPTDVVIGKECAAR
ncbi:MAG: DUF4012 domain-containing protein [Micropruina sp.]|uniref:DUF4012 domain-containing protein n=1 Tax=Micropruina sp. TaxID=2737536 RepID=UPI0039E3ADB4